MNDKSGSYGARSRCSPQTPVVIVGAAPYSNMKIVAVRRRLSSTMSQGTFDLQLVDYAIIVVYFVGVIAHGLWVSRGHESADDYFLAGRNLPWFLIGFSLFASNMSGSSFVGLMGASYDNGLVVFTTSGRRLSCWCSSRSLCCRRSCVPGSTPSLSF